MIGFRLAEIFSFFDDRHYHGRRRIAVHGLMWIGILILLCVFEKENFLEQNPTIITHFVLRDFAVIFIIFYLMAYFGIPQLTAGHWFIFFLSCLLSFMLLHFSMYFIFSELNAKFPNDRSISGYCKDYLPHGYWGGLFIPTIIWYNSIWNATYLFIPLFLKVVKEISMSQIKNAQLAKDNIRLELDFLKAQVNPHFLFNTLNNIYSLIVDKEPEAAAITMKLSNLMRFSLYESSSDKIPLESEIKFIENYIELEQIRHSKHVKINIEIEGNTEKMMVPPFILVTFVENAFKHGVNSTIRASWVNIKIKIVQKILHFEIENSKPANLSKDTNEGGVGLWNVKKRIEMLYPKHHELKINNTLSAYKVNLKLNLHE